MSWLAELVASDASDEALAAMLDEGFGMELVATEQALRSPYPDSPSGSTSSSSPSMTDCTDTASDNGAEWASSCDAERLSLPLKREEDKEVARAAANRARLYRYYRSQGELVGLRRKAVELQALLDRLKKEDARTISVSLDTAPCPFTDDADDEIDTHDTAPLKMVVASSPVGSTDWKRAAMEERRRLKRAQAVRRKLKRLIRDCACTSELFAGDCQPAQVSTGFGECESSLPPPRTTPMALSLPGADTAEALMSSGVVILREVYHIACSACGISPSESVPLSNTGGKLAYQLLLGADVTSCWTREYAFPKSDPRNIASLWLRGVRGQGPRRNLLRNIVKTHSLQHTCFERKFTWRPEALRRPVPVEMDGATVMQTFEADDYVALVWTVSFHANGCSAPPPPVFRGSGWMVFRASRDGTVSCRSCARVHSARPASGALTGTNIEREAAAEAWAETMKTKQRNMWQRLLLVV